MATNTGLHFAEVTSVRLACEQLTATSAVVTLHIDACELMLEFTPLNDERLRTLAALHVLPKSDDYLLFDADRRIADWAAHQRWTQWHLDQQKRCATQRTLGLSGA